MGDERPVRPGAHQVVYMDESEFREAEELFLKVLGIAVTDDLINSIRTEAGLLGIYPEVLCRHLAKGFEKGLYPAKTD